MRNGKDNEKICLVKYNAMSHYPIVSNGSLPNKLGDCFSLLFHLPTIIFPFLEFEPSAPLGTQQALQRVNMLELNSNLFVTALTYSMVVLTTT